MRAAWLSVGLLACHNLEGEWEGECTGESDDLGLAVTVDTDSGGDVYGSAVATFTIAGVASDAELDLEGSRDGGDIALDLDGSGWALSLDGVHGGGVIEGDCLLEITVLGLTVADEGSFTLERVD